MSPSPKVLPNPRRIRKSVSLKRSSASISESLPLVRTTPSTSESFVQNPGHSPSSTFLLDLLGLRPSLPLQSRPAQLCAGPPMTGSDPTTNPGISACRVSGMGTRGQGLWHPSEDVRESLLGGLPLVVLLKPRPEKGQHQTRHRQPRPRPHPLPHSRTSERKGGRAGT